MMDVKTSRQHRKITKAHSQKCWKWDDARRDRSCYSDCPVKHSACFLTDPEVPRPED